MRRTWQCRPSAVGIGCALALWATAANATPVVLVSETRSVEGSYTIRDPFTFEESFHRSSSDAPAVPFADFTSEFDAFPGAYAFQHSTLSPLEFVVQMETTAFGSDPLLESAFAFSSFEIDFDVTEPTDIQLAGTLDNSQGFVVVSLFRRDLPGTEWQNRVYVTNGETGEASFSGILEPGGYGLRIQTQADGATLFGAVADVTATFGAGPAIPEPGTALLLGIGLIVLARARSEGSLAG